jgi:hypothetical protein
LARNVASHSRARKRRRDRSGPDRHPLDGSLGGVR